MQLAHTKFATLFYHELWWLSRSIVDKCESVFNGAEVPDDGYVFQVDPVIHSTIASLLSDAANIKKLVLTSDVKTKGENGEAFKLRKERARELEKFIQPLGLKELLNQKVRNTLEHFDEYLDAANYSVSKRSFEGRPALYNVIISHWEVFSVKAYPIRLYVSSERKFYNMKWSVDIGLIYIEAKSLVEKLIAEVFPGDDPGGLILQI